MNRVGTGILVAKTFLPCLAILYASTAYSQNDTVAGAKYEVLDRFGVNMASGQVRLSQTPLSIGGAMGLNHTISSQTSDFVNLRGHGGGSPSIYGFGDVNRGGLYSVVLYKWGMRPNNKHYGLRVYGGGASEDFKQKTGGGWLPHNRPSSSTFEFVDDAEFTGHVMTTGDGIRRYYPGPEITVVNSIGLGLRSMSKVVYPNGFTIDVSAASVYDGPVYSVRTNTGFQLKYDFSGSWTVSSPTKVTALNNAIERCPHDSTSCTPSSIWPFSTYTWPVNEPDLTDIEALKDPSVFRVTDSEGRITDYHHESFQTNGGLYAPRIVKVERGGDVVMNYAYSYNEYDLMARVFLNHTLIYIRGVVSVARADVPGGGAQIYQMHIPKLTYGNTRIGNYNRGSSGLGRISLVESSEYGAFKRIDTWDQTVNFLYSLSDDNTGGPKYVETAVTSVHQKAGDTTVTFQYDSRGNITQRTAAGISTLAQYPSTCDSTNFRYCNKPEWIEDARGNRTRFNYHAPSGRISLKTLPADNSGYSSRTYYEYDEYYAHFKIDSETIEAADSPIWLLSKETSCQGGHMLSNGVCASGDAVVTTYEYDYFNLLLIGVAVTAKNTEGATETRRRCFEYDDYGNKIGETSPRANLASCE